MEYNNVKAGYDEANLAGMSAPRLTDPRVLDKLPVFAMLEGGTCLTALQEGGLKSLFGEFYQEKPVFSENHLFSLLCGGADLEGSFLKGNISLAYDSLKPGTAAKMRGGSAEISTYIPDASKRAAYVVRAYGRKEDSGATASLFVREAGGKEYRKYFSGSSSEYTGAEISFAPEADGTVIGISYEGGAAFLLDRIDVYSADAPQKERFTFYEHCTLSGGAYLSGGGLILENPGCEAFVTLFLQESMSVAFEAKSVYGDNDSHGYGVAAGFFFVEQEGETRRYPIHDALMKPYAVPISGTGRVRLGFMVNGAGTCGLVVKNICLGS